MKKVITNLFNNDPKILFVDIGAAGKIPSRFEKISNILRIIGFEPDSRAFCDETNRKIINQAVWSKNGEVEINLAKKNEVSSFYEPNFNILNKFPNSDRFSILSKTKVQAILLDDLKEDIDFLKIDVQGGELEVLKGATKSLTHVLGLEIEVEFLELYNKQPLFGDINSFLKLNGFEFIDFITLNRWDRHGTTNFSQSIFADALYLKSPDAIVNSNSLFYIKKYLAILLLYNRYDLIDCVYNNSNIKEKSEFKLFYKKITIYKLRHNLVRKLNNLINLFLAKITKSEYQSHIIY